MNQEVNVLVNLSLVRGNRIRRGVETLPVLKPLIIISCLNNSIPPFFKFGAEYN
jgi:hypothetical protein